MIYDMEKYQRSCVPDGEYTVSILSPKGVPEHMALITEQDGKYCVDYTTEHGKQRAEAELNNGSLYFEYEGGSCGDEKFGMMLKVYPYGDIMLGDTYRVEVEAAPPSPVVCIRR